MKQVYRESVYHLLNIQAHLIEMNDFFRLELSSEASRQSAPEDGVTHSQKFNVNTVVGAVGACSLSGQLQTGTYGKGSLVFSLFNMHL